MSKLSAIPQPKTRARRLRRSAFLLAATALGASAALGASPSAAQITTSGEVSPSPPTSPIWVVPSDLRVGIRGSGAMHIGPGGQVSSLFGQIGVNKGSSGVVTVDGATWSADGGVRVGSEGTGILTITGGGRVTGMTGAVNGAGLASVATVSGAGSAWIATRELFIAPGTGRGDAILNIEAGGLVSANIVFLGDYAFLAGSGKTAFLNVRGAGSSLVVGSQLDLGTNGLAAATIADGGSVVVGGSIYATGSVVNIGAAPGQAPVAAGTLSAFMFSMRSTELNFNHTSRDYVFATPIFGFGTINHWAGETTLTGVSPYMPGFTGNTTVYGGVLSVDSQLGGTLLVRPGGRLGGVGRVGTTTVQGTVAPGHSIGTLTIGGFFSQTSGSTYQVELNTAGLSDHLHVWETATIADGAVLNVVKTDTGLYRPGVRYTVLTADAGLIGTYTLTGDLTSGYFTRLVASYDANSVYLDVVKSRTFASVGLSRNQIAVGGAADGLAVTGSLASALLALPDAGSARAAFDQLSGSGHASTKAMIIEDSRVPRDAAVNRLRDAFGDVGAPATTAGPADGAVVWGDVFGGWGTLDGNSNASTLKRDLGGVIFGVDIPAFDGWRLGLLGGYGHSKYKTRDTRYAGSSDDYHLGVYGGGTWNAVALRAGAAVTSHHQDARRSVAFPGLTDTLEADPRARTTQAFGELGYRIGAGGGASAITLEPFASLAYVSVKTNAFREKGGAAALSAQDDRANVTFTTLGLRAASSVDLGGSALTMRGALGWRRAFGDTEPASRFAFADGSSFAATGTPIEKDAAVVELGLDARLSSRATLGLAYGAQFAGTSTDQTVRGGLSVKF